MSRHFRSLSFTILTVLVAITTQAAAQQPIADYTRSMEKRDGYFPVYWDAARGRLFLEIARMDEGFLYLPSLATGVGSEPLGLDRGLIGQSMLARFTRVGPKVLFTIENTDFRALRADNAALARSVEESFATSTIAAFDVVAEDGGRALVDVTTHFLTDVMDVRGSLRRDNAGTFQLDRERSAYYLAHTRAFPENTEIEASLTFTSDAPGAVIRQHAPEPRAFTVRQHHSLVKLPPPGYAPRRFNTRAGVNGISFYDFSKGYEEPYESGFIRRHRLVKQNPNAAVSDPVKPIVYYMDPGIQEPYRTAFKQGLAWYERVFRAAGFSNAFRVEDMPPDMDPLDARYNVIQWMHRSDIGASVGPSFVDPRTGEIIKAAVRMDSYRSLTNYDLLSGALGEADGFGLEELADWLGTLAQQSAVDEAIIARRRQHAAHEVGHTLGLPHNFAASKYGRGSVMDYPAPLIRLVNGRLDLSQAYRVGPGLWDTLAIRYAYTQFPAGQEETGLAAIAAEMFATNAEFITNPDNGASGSYPEASAWDNGNDAVAELARVMDVRRFLIDRFDERAIRSGAPLYLLGRRFAFAYLHHRWTLEAAIKAVGGMEYHYASRGDPIPPTRIVDGARQRRALDLVLRALSPEELAIPERLLRTFAPRPFGSGPDRWAFGSAAGPAFDQIGAARSLAAYTVSTLLHPERTARVVAFAARDPSLPALEVVVGTVVDRTWAPAPDGPEGTLARAVQRVVVDELIRLAANADATVESRAAAEWGLRRIGARLGDGGPGTGPAQAHRMLAAADIQRFLDRRALPTGLTEPLPIPPNMPLIPMGGR
ncbi:MAG: hypothetical protein A2W29_11130 [Gemmatimonadetes bacterium RBG_16_66_8]|nr:MAG: hypothetical protein A2W29_11130 [Gemmatimonadetes bacterium RBG_16_66_8]